MNEGQKGQLEAQKLAVILTKLKQFCKKCLFMLRLGRKAGQVMCSDKARISLALYVCTCTARTCGVLFSI